MASAFSGVGAVVLGGALLLAAFRKGPALDSLVAVFEALGLPRWMTKRATAYAVVSVEFVAAGLLVIAPGSIGTSVVVGGLFLAFAGAGAAALTRGQTIVCACFGANGRHSLGVRQILQLLVVAPVLAACAAWPPGWTAIQGVALLTGTGAVVAGLLAAQCAADWQKTRTMRLSLRAARAATRELGLEGEIG